MHLRKYQGCPQTTFSEFYSEHAPAIFINNNPLQVAWRRQRKIPLNRFSLLSSIHILCKRSNHRTRKQHPNFGISSALALRLLDNSAALPRLVYGVLPLIQQTQQLRMAKTWRAAAENGHQEEASSSTRSSSSRPVASAGSLLKASVCIHKTAILDARWTCDLRVNSNTQLAQNFGTGCCDGVARTPFARVPTRVELEPESM